jgi:hypothetical protein
MIPREEVTQMKKAPTTIHTKSGVALAVLSKVDVVNRARAEFKEALGWSYRFKSAEGWVLLPVDEVAWFEFEDKPEEKE